jgi:GNAT superfamily N-acetyltransferase
MKYNCQIREYTDSDMDCLVQFTEGLQDYLIALDPLGRLIRTPDYGRFYADECLKRVERQSGKVYLAFLEDRPVGFIIGIIDEEAVDVGRGYIPTKAGRVLELFVTEEARGTGVGKKLMARLEEYFHESGCSIARVEVFTTNRDAKDFYHSLGFSLREEEHIKVLR